MAVEPALMAAAIAADKKRLEGGGEPKMIHGLFDFEDKPYPLVIKTTIVLHGLNPHHLAKAQYVVDVAPVLKDGLLWASEGFGKGVVIDGKHRRPVNIDDMKVHPNGGRLHVHVTKHNVREVQVVSIDPKTNYLKHDSEYKGLNWDAAIVAAATWLRDNLKPFEQILAWTGGDLAALNRPFDDGAPKPKQVSAEEFRQLAANAGRPVSPHSVRSKKGAQLPGTPVPQVVERPSQHELRPLEVRWPWGGGCTLMAPVHEHMRQSKLASDITLALHVAALKLDPNGALAGHIAPELEGFMAQIQARLANLPRPSQVDMADVLTVERVAAVILASPGPISALNVIPEATDGFLTRYHEDWSRALVRLRDIKARLEAAIAEAKPGWHLVVESKAVTIGEDARTGKPIKEPMPVYRLESDDAPTPLEAQEVAEGDGTLDDDALDESLEDDDA